MPGEVMPSVRLAGGRAFTRGRINILILKHLDSDTSHMERNCQGRASANFPGVSRKPGQIRENCTKAEL